MMDMKAKGKAVMKYLAAAHDVGVDRWGNVKFTGANGKDYRYKLMTNVIRVEVKVHHAGTAYNKATTEWMRVKTLPVKKNFENLVAKGLIKVD